MDDNLHQSLQQQEIAYATSRKPFINELLSESNELIKLHVDSINSALADGKKEYAVIAANAAVIPVVIKCQC